jgi:hypothetical protein
LKKKTICEFIKRWLVYKLEKNQDCLVFKKPNKNFYKWQRPPNFLAKVKIELNSKASKVEKTPKIIPFEKKTYSTAIIGT